MKTVQAPSSARIIAKFSVLTSSTETLVLSFLWDSKTPMFVVHVFCSGIGFPFFKCVIYIALKSGTIMKLGQSSSCKSIQTVIDLVLGAS